MELLEERALLSVCPTLTTLSVPATALVGQPLSFTADVTVPGDLSAMPSGGSVTFMDGTTCLGTAPLVDGQASIVNSLFSGGSHTITASYQGAAAGLADSTSNVDDVSVTNGGSGPSNVSAFALPCDTSVDGGVSPMTTAGPTGMTPTQIRQAYGFSSVSFGSQAADGTGTTIAIIDAYDDPNIANDLTAFDTYFGLPAPPSFTKVNQTGGSSYPAANADWITEIALDVEWSHAVAPGASILLVEANSNSNSDLYTAVDYARNAPGVVAVSMSWGGGESSSESSSDSHFTTPAGHAGVTFLASSGDTGAPTQYPSASPNVVSVGGTTLTLSGNNYSSESAWSGSGGGISSYESQPAYQKGVVTQSSTYRTDPDVSYDSNPSTGFPVYDSYNNGTVKPWGQWGGTSDAAPQWAALVAIADQGRALSGYSSLDGPSATLPLLYAAPAGDFHDITTGASTGSPNYSAGPGYDLVTGRGTPCANQLILYLAAPSALSTTTTLSASAGTITYGQSITLTATVSLAPPGTGTVNGGSVTFFDDGTAIDSAPVSNGTASFTSSTLGYGVHQFAASYSGYGFTYWPSATPPAGLTSVSVITTIAGDGIGDGLPATDALLAGPVGVAVDSSGDLFIADTNDNRVREVNHATGVITTVAGTGTAGYSGDGGQATAAELHTPWGLALDSSNDLYIADCNDNRIRKVNLTTGAITTVAGNGTAGYNGDGIQATAADLEFPEGIALDGSGNLYIADSRNNRIRKVNLATGVITTVAGTGSLGYNGDRIQATAAVLYYPAGVAVDSAGNIYIADFDNERIRKVTVATGLITTVAGTGTAGHSGDNGPATAATLYSPRDVVVDVQGDLFITDWANQRIREVYANGTITTLVGNGTSGYSGDGGAATGAELAYPSAVVVDSSGNLYIADCSNNRIRAVNLSTGIISTCAGGLGEGGAATAAALDAPYGEAVDSAGDIFIADTNDNLVREINGATGLISIIAGTGIAGYNGDNIQATAAMLFYPRGVAVDNAGNLYIADSDNQRIRKVNLATGVITTVAGDGIAGFSGDGGAATAAEMWNPYAVALDSFGDLFIADYSNQRIREVQLSSGIITTMAGGGALSTEAATAAPLDQPQNVVVDASGNLYIVDTMANCVREVNRTTGLISTVAGTGTAGYNGDNIQATTAELDEPYGVALDSAGNLYIADRYNSRVRKVNLSTGVITTVAGNGGAGFSGDNGQATAAELDYPQSVAVDTSGDLFIADSLNNRVREVTLATGVITTVAGTGTPGYNGDGIQATAATLNQPSGVAVDVMGNLYIADSDNQRMRKVVISTGVITTVAGDGTQGFSGNGGAATAAELSYPDAVAVDAAGDLLIADKDNVRVREVYAASGTIVTIAGNGSYGFNGDGLAATAASLSFVGGVAVDSAGNVYIADTSDCRIREVLAGSGLINTVAGNGYSTYGGDGGAATAATLYYPTGLAVDAAGDVYIADSGNERIRIVNRASGVITTVAGSQAVGYAGDGGAATAASLENPQGIGLDSAGDLLIADSGNNRIREVHLATGIITTIAGSSAGFGGDGGPAGSALFSDPTGVAIDAGNLLVVDSGNNRIRQITASGASLIVNPAAVSGTSLVVSAPPAATYGGLVSLSATLQCSGIALCGESISFTFDGALLATAVTNGAGVAAVSAATKIVPATYSGGLLGSFAGTSWFTTSNGAANLTITPAPLTIAANNTTKMYGAPDAFTASYAGFVAGAGPAHLGGTLLFSTNEPVSGFAPAGSYTITPSGLTSNNYAITFVPGTLTVTGAATSTALSISTSSSTYGQLVTLTTAVAAVAPSAATPTGGSVTFMDGSNAVGTAGLSNGQATLATTALAVGSHSLWAIYNGDGLDFSASATNSLSTATITTAGKGSPGYSGDGGLATAAEINSPYAIAADANGDIFIADAANNRIREVSPTGTITTVAGNGVAGYSGDGGPATAASLYDPFGVAVDDNGHLFIADAINNRIREVNLATGIITTVAGNGTGGYSGDGGRATAAELHEPYAVFVDGAGHLFIGDFANNRIREVDFATGIITTVAGNGTGGYSGDGGPATAAELDFPEGIAVDASGNLFIADQGNARVREVSASAGLITTVAGTGAAGYSGDGGQATAAEISYPRCVAVDSTGDLFISDTNNARIREVNLASGVITTVVGDGVAGFSGDGASATAAEIYYPRGIALDPIGRLLIADNGNDRVRVVTPSSLPLALTVSPAPLTVTAANQTKIYGAAPPALTVDYAGFVNGDTAASLTTAPNLTTTASAASPVGNYAITASGAVDPNYAIVYVPGTLTVTPAPLTVTANDQSKFYGAVDLPLTYTITGTFYNGDGPSVVTGVTLTTTTGAAATAGTHTITASGGTAANYAITDVNGTLTVLQAPLTVTANDDSKNYGQTTSYGSGSTAFTSSGLQNGETIGSVTIAANGGTAANATVGSYTLTPSAAAGGTFNAANYNLTYDPGTLTVNAAPLTVTANDDSKTYGQTKNYGSGSTAFTVIGLQNAETIGSVTVAANGGTAANATVGSYTLTPSAAAGGTFNAANYSITYDPGLLTVAAAAPTLAITDPGGIYNGSAYPAAVTVTGVNGIPASSLEGVLPILLYYVGSTPTGAGSSTAPSAAGTYTAVGSFGGSADYSAVSNSVTFQITKWCCAGSGAFAGSGTSDLLWQNQNTGAVELALLNGGAISSWVILGSAPPTVWKLAGIGNFTGNGTGDILWINTQSGEVGLWLINNATVTGWATLAWVDLTTWNFKGVGDFNGDGTSDVLWESNSGAVGAWLIKNAAASAWAGMAYANPAQWTIIGLGDLTGNGTTDVLWQNTLNGAVGAWLVSNGSVSAWRDLGSASPSAWQLVGVGNFTNNGGGDLLWESLTTPGTYGAWLVQSNSVSWASLPYADPTQWALLPVANLAGNATSNIVWENVCSGLIGAWDIQNAAVVGWWTLGVV